MGVLERFERRLEGLVEGLFARAFKSEVQPVEIASALQRELDARATIVSRERALVPNAFTVELSRRDHERLAPYGGPLQHELAEMVRDHAREQSYQFTGPVTVTLQGSDKRDTGVFHVRSEVVPGSLDDSPPPRPAPPRPAPRPASGAVGSGTVPGPTGSPAGAPTGRQPVSPTRDTASQAASRRGAPGFVVQEGSPHAYSVELTSPVTVIGRGPSAGVRLTDPGVSREYAEVRLAGAHVVLNDLRSTNGTQVNGARVATVELADGDRVTVGETSMVFHATVPQNARRDRPAGTGPRDGGRPHGGPRDAGPRADGR